MSGNLKGNKKSTAKPTVALVGAGRLATSLALSLRDAGFTIRQIITRDSGDSRPSARALAASVGAQAGTADLAALDATLFWFCVPDGEIRSAASALAHGLTGRQKSTVRFAFHSSGALLSGELDPLRQKGVAVAAVHPLMTFVARSHPSLNGVPFALEGDAPATRMARQIVRALGGESFLLPASRKPAYHAWATMTSPLFVAFLVTLEEVARGAGLTRQEARRKSLPIITQTLTNYSRLGPSHSFSGPFVRGDAETVAKHLAVLRQNPAAQKVYVALARSALRALPVKNRKKLAHLLRL